MEEEDEERTKENATTPTHYQKLSKESTQIMSTTILKRAHERMKKRHCVCLFLKDETEELKGRIEIDRSRNRPFIYMFVASKDPISTKDFSRDEDVAIDVTRFSRRWRSSGEGRVC